MEHTKNQSPESFISQFDKISMFKIYAVGMASLLATGLCSAALQAGEDGFFVFLFFNLGAFTFFTCLASMLVKLWRAKS